MMARETTPVSPDLRRGPGLRAAADDMRERGCLRAA